MAVIKKSLGSDSPKLATICHACAELQWEMGKSTEVLKSIQQEEAILQKMVPIPNEKLVANLSLQIYIYESLGMPRECDRAYARLYVQMEKGNAKLPKEEWRATRATP